MKNIEDVKKELEFEFLIHKPNKEHMEVPMESPMCKAYLEIIKVKNEAEKALKAIPEYQAREEALEAKEKANRAVEATPEWKTLNEVEKAYNEAYRVNYGPFYTATENYKVWEAEETKDETWEAVREAEKARERARDALEATPAYKDYMKASCVCSKMKQYYLDANWNWIDARRSAKSTLKEGMDEEAW